MAENEKWKDPCPRCGAEAKWPCEPIRPGEWPTVLRPHRERGASPWWLRDRGYFQYSLVDEAGFKLFLWRRPGQPAVVREGWHQLDDDVTPRRGVRSMTWTITGRVCETITFPEHPQHGGGWGLVGGEDVWTERTTFRSTTEAARWCERILRGDAPRPRWRTDGPVLEPHTGPQWETAEVIASTDDYRYDDVVYRWTGQSWEEGRD